MRSAAGVTTTPAGEALVEAAPRAYAEVVALCRQANVTPALGPSGRTVQTILALVAAGFGACVMADAYRALHREGVAVRPLQGAMTTLHLVHRAGDDRPALSRLLRHLTTATPPQPVRTR